MQGKASEEEVLERGRHRSDAVYSRRHGTLRKGSQGLSSLGVEVLSVLGWRKPIIRRRKVNFLDIRL